MPQAKTEAPGAKGKAGTGVFAALPALVIGMAVLWDWTVRLWDWAARPYQEHIDLFHYLYYGQRLAEGALLWTQEYNDRLPVDQFVFWLPAWLHSVLAWHVMSMGACLLGAWAVYALLRDLFSPARGFPSQLGRYAGLYGGVFTLYLFSALAEHNNGGLNQINVLPVSLALVAAVLTKRALGGASGARVQQWPVFLLACFCASLAVGLRPYLAVFVALIPLWVALAAQLEKICGGGGVNDGKAIAKFALLWNACLALFFLIVNALPYALLGEWEAFAAGIAMLAQDTSWNDNLPRIVYRTVKALALQDWLSNLLFLAWLLFAVLLLGMVLALRLGIFKAGPRPLAFLSGAVLFELCVLTLVVPFSIEAMILAKRFWSHYMQLFAPFAALGAVCLYVLVCQANPRHLDLPIMHKAAALLLALLLVSGPVSNLKTKVRHPQPDTTPESLAALLDELGQEGDFLAPYNIYVHWRLNQHRHGFPHVTHTVRIIGATPWRTEEWRGLQVPAHFRLPTSLEGYCRMLDDRGPRLVVFFTPPRKASREGHNPLLDCELREYALHDLSAGPLVPYDVSHYFLRR